MTRYTAEEHNLIVTALGRLLRDARNAPAEVAAGYEADPDVIEALRDKVRADPAGDVHVATADVAAGFLAVGNTAEQARAALYAALRRYADDLYLDPTVITDAAVQTVSGPPGAVFLGGERYPPAG